MIVKELIEILQTMDENHRVVVYMNQRVSGTTCYTGKEARKIDVEYKFGDCVISAYDR
jgi:hypothetical protein